MNDGPERERPVNIVRVTAPSEVLRWLHDIDGFEMAGSLREVGGGVWSTAAYATDEAIDQVRARGAQVELVVDAETRMAHLHREAREAAGAAEEEGS